MKDMNILEVAGGKPIKLWTQGVPVEEEARQQLLNTAKMPFIFKHLAVMPDVHLGKGSTIGSVIPTLGAIIPAAVGVDIGCGMIAARTSLVAADLPDNLHGLRDELVALPETPADLDAVVLKCLEKEREHRYPSAQALAEDLERYRRDEPVTASRERVPVDWG